MRLVQMWVFSSMSPITGRRSGAHRTPGVGNGVAGDEHTTVAKVRLRHHVGSPLMTMGLALRPVARRHRASEVCGDTEQTLSNASKYCRVDFAVPSATDSTSTGWPRSCRRASSQPTNRTKPLSSRRLTKDRRPSIEPSFVGIGSGVMPGNRMNRTGRLW